MTEPREAQTASPIPGSPPEAVSMLLQGLNKGQYLILVEAIRQLGGELRLDTPAWLDAVKQPWPTIKVDADDGPIVLRIL